MHGTFPQRHVCCVQGLVVVQHSQLDEFVEALGAQRRFGFCCVPLPPMSPTPPVLPESLRLPQPNAGGLASMYAQSLRRAARHICCKGQPHSRKPQLQRTWHTLGPRQYWLFAAAILNH